MSDGCKCGLATRLVGDGCQYCNPQMAIDLLEERVQELRLTPEEREAIARAAETLRYLQADYGETQTEKDSYTLRNLLERHT